MIWYQRVNRYDTKSKVLKGEKTNKWISSQNCTVKSQLREQKDKLQSGSSVFANYI